jgi:beta-xylosidase
LFLSGVDRVRLTPDGLATDGETEPAYEGWRYPEDWVVEGFSLEGPKLLRRGEWFYLVCAVGGTAGPATGHMITVARSRSVLGPWEDDPANPLVRCTDPAQPWWSRGHGTLVEGPDGRWWALYHGYERGYQTLGRQQILEPIEWTDDGWPRPRWRAERATAHAGRRPRGTARPASLGRIRRGVLGAALVLEPPRSRRAEPRRLRRHRPGAAGQGQHPRRQLADVRPRG